MNQTIFEIPVNNAETGQLQPRTSPWALLLAIICAVAPASAWAAPRQDTIVILLDASGSMKSPLQGSRGSRMDAAKAALKTVIRQVPQTTEVGLLVFSSSNLTNDWAFPLGPRNDAQLFAVLDSIREKTDTPLGRYLKIAADRLLEERAKRFGYGTYRLIVVTDGEAQDQNLVEQYTPEIIGRGITVDVIGVGMKKAHTLATKVHSYRSANDMAALNRALSEVFAEVRVSKNDAAEAELFQTIAGIPDGVASGMIQAVASTPNHPIGQAPVVAPSSSPPQDQPPAQLQPQSQPQPQTQPQQQSQPPATTTHHTKSNKGTFGVIIVVLLVVARVISAGRGRRR